MALLPLRSLVGAIEAVGHCDDWDGGLLLPSVPRMGWYPDVGGRAFGHMAEEMWRWWSVSL